MEDFSHYLSLRNNRTAEEPALSSTPLGERLASIPLDLVDQSDFIEMSQDLSIEELIPTEEGLFRDYRGLAEGFGFSSTQIEGHFKRLQNPTLSIIHEFIGKLHSRGERATLNDLLKALERIERFDVIDDLLPKLIRIERDHQLVSLSQQQSIGGLLPLVVNSNQALELATIESGNKMLTVDDTSHSQVNYDAFVCHAPQDINLAEELIEFLTQNGVRVASAEDLLAGQLKHNALTSMIDSRCKKILVVLTSNFLTSSECNFEKEYALGLALEPTARVIPVIYENCHIPSVFKLMCKIDLTNRLTKSWALERLLKSLALSHPASAGRSPALSRRQRSPTSEPIVELQVSQDWRGATPDVSQIDLNDTNSRSSLISSSGSSMHKAGARSMLAQWMSRDR